jgi:hypothetical protein
MANQPDLNNSLLARARKAIQIGLVTEFEAKAVKMMNLSGGLSKNKKYQVIVNELGDAKLAGADVVLKPIWDYAISMAGTAPSAASGSAAAPAPE